MSKSSIAKPLSIFSLVMITVVSVDSIRNLPATALFGSSLIFFFIAAAICFLIPCALVSAELAAGGAKTQNGVYGWVKEAFGETLGLAAIWFQWIENVIWYPTILAFVAGTIGYQLNPALVQNEWFIISVILCTFWGVTFLNLMGIKFSAQFSNICAIAGLLIPMTLIISLGVFWIVQGEPLAIQFDLPSLMPHFNDSNIWISLTGIMLSFCGIEIAAVHARDVHNPQRSFPIALMYAVGIITSTLLLGALSIALVLPHKDISLVAGIMQAFDMFFSHYHLSAILPLIALMLVIGGVGSVSNWIIAPVRGLLMAAQDGLLPKQLLKENRHGAPSRMLIYQAIIVSVLSLCFKLIPSINGSYWFLTALTSQLYMLMYILMFSAALRLRFSAPNRERKFTIPGGKLGLLLVCGLGISACVTTIIVGFIPPTDLVIGSTSRYETLLIGGLLFFTLLPLGLAKWYKGEETKELQPTLP